MWLQIIARGGMVSERGPTTTDEVPVEDRERSGSKQGRRASIVIYGQREPELVQLWPPRD